MNEATFEHGYALLIGVGETKNPRFSLPATVHDMTALRDLLVDANLCGYRNDTDHIRLLCNEKATASAILDGLAWLSQQCENDADATVVVFYSGHGVLDPTELRYFLLPHNIDPNDYAGTALAADNFTDALRQINAKRLLVLIDACHAEGMATSKGEATGDDLQSQVPPKQVLNALKAGEGRAVFTSSRGKERSWLRKDGAMSIYSYHLLEALQGAGNLSGDSTVRLSNLMNHLGKSVPASASQAHAAKQTPFFDTASEDFPIAVLRGGKGLPAGGWGAVEKAAQEKIQTLVKVEVKGSRNVTAGGNMENNTIVTGNNNVVGSNNRVTRSERIDTGGGTFIRGNVNTGGGDFVGRDKVVGAPIATVAATHLETLFAPVLVIAQSADAAKRAAAIEAAQSLKTEIAKGSQANDKRIGQLIQTFVVLVPSVPTALVVATLSPLVVPVGGAVTEFVLEQL